MKIKISKAQWELIGKKVGWFKKAQVSAPTKAPTKTPTPTKTPSNPPTPTKTPFNPPRPKVLPKPKAKKEEKVDNFDMKDTLASGLKNMLKVAAKPYEEGAHQSVRNFWMNIPEDHPFNKHPILSEYGHNLSEGGYSHITKQTDLPNKPSPMAPIETLTEIQQLLKKVIILEKSHEEQLIDEAKNVIAKIWGIDKSMLDGKLGQDQENKEGEEQEMELLPLDVKLKNEVDKRLTMNTLTQGSAVHAMNSIHHMVEDILKRISPDLLATYTRLSGLLTQQYYILDIEAITKAAKSQLKNAATGWSHVEYKEEQPEQPKIVAQGIIFPILCQELFKGVMELLSFHGIDQNLSEQELNTIYHYADRLEDEPWLLTIGPELWRKFLAVLPKDLSLSEVMMELNQKPAQELHRIIGYVIQNPKQAKKVLEGLKKVEPKQEDKWVDSEPTGEEPIGDEMDVFLDGIIKKDNPIAQPEKANMKCPKCNIDMSQEEKGKYYCPICNYTK